MKKTKIIIMTFGLYILNMIIIPIVFVDILGHKIIGHEINNISIILTIIYSISGITVLTDKLRYWLMSDIIFIILVFLYHRPGIYGIGLPIISWGFEQPSYRKEDAWFGIIFCAIVYFLIQFVVWICIKLIKFLRSKKSRR